MKKFLLFTLAIFLAHHAFALEYTLDGLNFSLDEEALTAEITGYTEITDGQILIPATIEYEQQDYKVTSIASYALKASEATSLTFVEPSNVTKINLMAFYQCANIKTVDLPTSLETISGSGFRECTSLETVIIHGSVTKIYDYTFMDCTSLESVYCASGADILNGYYDVFKNISETATLYVADAETFASETYKWSTYFANIVDYTFPDLYIDGIYYNIVSDLKSTTVQLEVTTGPIAYTGDMVIPEDFEYEGTYYSVVALNDKAFDNCVDLNSVTINTPVENMEALLMTPVGCTIIIPSNQQAYEKCLEIFATNDADSDNIVFMGDYVKSGNTIAAIATVTTERVPLAIYNLSGHSLSTPTKGIDVILYSDGTIEKVLVK